MKKLLTLFCCISLMLPSFTVTVSAGSKQQQIAYGTATVGGEVLTDFTDGNVIGNASSANNTGTMAIKDGVLVMQSSKGSYVECYTYYSGANIGAESVKNAKYICFDIANPTDGDVLFNFQGTRSDGSKFRTSQKVAEDNSLYLLLVTQAGAVSKAEMENSNSRLAAKIPAGFKGTLIIPTNCVAAATDQAPNWDKGGNLPFKSLGFYIFDKGEGTGGGIINVNTMFIITDELPQTDIADKPAEQGITNPEYSYTDAERIKPYWTDSIMHNECIAFEQDENGNITAHTMFVPKRIICVINNAHKKEFTAGVDYTWIEGTNELKWLEGSAIPYFYKGALDGLNEENGTEYVKNWDGSFDETGRSRMAGRLYCIGSFLYEKQLSVTYEYDIKQTQKIQHTEYQPDSFKNVAQKIKNGEQLKIVMFGTSTFEGCDASGRYNRAPNMPTMDKLLSNYLNDNNIPAKITNIGVGGWNAVQGLAALKGEKEYTINGVTKPLVKGSTPVGNTHKKAIEGGDVDLVIIGHFGGNNSGSGVSPELYKQSLKEAIELILSYNPDCEFIMLSGSITYELLTDKTDYYYKKTQELAEEYKNRMGYVDLIKMYKDMLFYKDFASLSGNNINHPNDFSIRAMVMEVLSSFVPGFNGNDEETNPDVTEDTTQDSTGTADITSNPTSEVSANPTKPADDGKDGFPWAVVAAVCGAVCAALAATAVVLTKKRR